MTNLETEFKLRTPQPIDVALVDATIRESPLAVLSMASRRHHDIYLDDARGSLAAQGIGLRVRVDRGSSTVTCKNRGHRDGAMFVREECEAPWPSPTTPPTAAELPPRLRDAIEPIVLRRPLVPVLRLDVTRELRRLARGESELCELAIDHVTAHGLGRSVKFTEIELEVIDDLTGCEELAAQLEASLHVEAAVNDKPTHAARLLGLPNPNGVVDLTKAAPASAALEAALRHLVAAVQQAEIRARTDPGAEPVHAMRTLVRRLRTVISALRDYWPPDEAHWLQSHLRALATELGRVRDLDEVTAGLPDQIAKLHADLQPAARLLLDRLRDVRRQGHADLVNWLRSGPRLEDAQRFAHLVFDLAARGETPEPSIDVATATTLNLHTDRLRRRSKPLTRDSSAAEFHAVRIAARRLRYLCEELAAFAPKGAAKMSRRLRRLQNALGSLCDHAAACRQLLAVAPQIRDDCDDPLVSVALGALFQRHFTAARRRRARVAAMVHRQRPRLDLPS